MVLMRRNEKESLIPTIFIPAGSFIKYPDAKISICDKSNENISQIKIARIFRRI